MDEAIDIYDANLGHIGAMDRLEAHMRAQWHRTFHCWVVNGAGSPRILFQMRSSKMANFPSMLDVSAAGHLEAGETVEQGVREVREELGVDFAVDALEFLGDRVEVADQSNGQRNREYQAVYLLRLDEELASYNPQIEEVAGLVWVDLASGLELFSGAVATTRVRGIVHDGESWEPVERTVSVSDFLPRIQRYYLSACIMGDRMLKGEYPLAIS